MSVGVGSRFWKCSVHGSCACLSLSLFQFPLPQTAPERGLFVVCVLFPIPKSNQALICSCSPVENFLWVWVTRRKRNAHAAWESFPSIKVTSHMHSESVVLANSFHPTVNSWGNIYTSEICWIFFLINAWKVTISVYCLSLLLNLSTYPFESHMHDFALAVGTHYIRIIGSW